VRSTPGRSSPESKGRWTETAPTKEKRGELCRRGEKKDRCGCNLGVRWGVDRDPNKEKEEPPFELLERRKERLFVKSYDKGVVLENMSNSS